MASEVASDMALLRVSVAGFLADAVRPGMFRDTVDSDDQQAFWRAGAAHGLLQIGLPSCHGGLDLGARGLAMVMRLAGETLAPGALLPTLAAGQVLAACASPVISARMTDLAAGRLRIANPAEYGRVAPVEMKGGLLSGRVEWMLSGPAEWMLVPVIDESQALGFAVIETDSTGVSIDALPGWDRTRDLFRLELTGVRPLWFATDERAREMLAAIDALYLLLVAADSLGGAERILGVTTQYLKDRRQFGRPIGQFQSLKHRVADHSARLTVNASLLEQALRAVVSGRGILWPALAKASITDSYCEIAADCVQLHGAVGLTWEHDCHLFLKRARLNQALGGANGVLRDIAAQAFGDSLSNDVDLLEIGE